MYKKLIVIAFLFIACIDFDIDAPYDDINGIYLEHSISYDISGTKIEIENAKGYIRIHGASDIVCYDLSDIYDIDTVSVFRSVDVNQDFAIADGYAYIVSTGFGLEIVDFNQQIPQLVGFFSISEPIQSIVLSNDRVYITSSVFYTETDLYTIDVSSVTNPISIAEYTFDDYIVHFEVESNNLYVLFDDGTFQIIDISSPTTPQLIAEHNLSDTLDNAYYFVKHDEYLYVAKGYDIETYEIETNGDLKYLNALSFDHSIGFLKTYGSYGICLYDGNLFDWLYLLNLTYPSRPCIGEYLDRNIDPRYAVINDQYIYVLGYILEIIEIKDIE